jgi:predicted amidohydrolase
VGASPTENAKYIRDFMHEASGAGAHLLHTSECSLSGEE